jgi:hypothetical protein
MPASVATVRSGRQELHILLFMCGDRGPRGDIVVLRHYARSRKVVGSSSDEVDLSRTMVLGSTHPLTEMSIRNHPVG